MNSLEKLEQNQRQIDNLFQILSSRISKLEKYIKENSSLELLSTKNTEKSDSNFISELIEMNSNFKNLKPKPNLKPYVESKLNSSFKLSSNQSKSNYVATFELVKQFREKGFVQVVLEENETALIQNFFETMKKHIFNHKLEKKGKLIQESKELLDLKNLFSYGIRVKNGKEFFKFRSVSSNCKDKITYFDKETTQDILSHFFPVYVLLQEISISILKIVCEATHIPNEYIEAYLEGWLEASHEVFSQSYLNAIYYWDDCEEPEPCRPHTDPVLITTIPLNTSTPALEFWDCESETWIALEKQNQHLKLFSQVVVFPGETLGRITNDQFLPSLHRVVHSNVSRFSCPLQYSAKKGVIIDTSPIDSLFHPPKEGETPIEVSEFMYNLTNSRCNEAIMTNRYRKKFKLKEK